MKRNGTHFKLILFATLLLQSPFAYSGSGSNSTAQLINTTGDYARQNSNGAIASRNTANELYQQALNNERAAWAKFPPNVGLLSKALTQSREAKMADDQAKEFARAAQHAIASGRASGDFNLKYYGVADEKTITSLATTNSPLQPQAESTLGGYGMKLDADKMSIKTPFGNMPLNMSLSTLDKGLGAIATSLGYSAADVSRGIQEAIQSRDAIAAKHMAAVNAQSAASAGAVAGANGGLGTSSEAPAANENQVAATEANQAQAASVDPAIGAATDDSKRQEELLRNRDQFLAKMGMEMEHQDPIHGPQTDLFKVVHLRYQSLRSEGEFDERDIGPKVAPVAKVLAKPILLPQPLARAPASQNRNTAQIKPVRNR